MTFVNQASTAKITGVAETLMITLYARYLETKRDDGIIQDKKAVEIVEKIDYDFTKFASGWASLLGSAIRAKRFDHGVSDFIKNHPNAVIVNLGSGLCTRFFRVENGKISWYEVDFPEVIELRQKLISETDRYKFIGKSIFNFTWMDEIQQVPGQPMLIIAEGVSMYLTKVQHLDLFKQIRDRFESVEMIIDIVSPAFARNTQGHDTVSKTNAEFKWGIKKVTELETWGLGIKVLDIDYYLTNFAQYPHRLQPFWLKYFIFILVPIFSNSSRIVHMQISQSTSA
ncbi:MAG: class I SAM-dependent methyltransferase [Trichormus sp. ATA11-4-KO1]|jgi:O-methyltransferase involved in polyketide biosynthesis|nr:class I SAM-dependent methyltransferase [Trichormus sp. ATA11-4-KO1]